MTLTGLTPGQTYFYQAGVEGYYWSQEYYFTTAPALYTTSNYTWAVMGDMGTVNPMGNFHNHISNKFTSSQIHHLKSPIKNMLILFL